MRFFKAKRWTKEEVLAVIREEWTTQRVADIAVEAGTQAAKRFDEANPYKQPLNVNHADMMGLVKELGSHKLGQGDVVFLQISEKVSGSRGIQLKEFSNALAHYLKPYGCNVVLLPHDARVVLAKPEAPPVPQAEPGAGVHRP